MSENYLQEFLEQITPFRDLWSSVRITCLAVRSGGVWLNLGTRVWLSELSSEAPRRISPVEDFCAFIVGLPMTALGYVLDSIVTQGFVPLDDAGLTSGNHFDKVYLTRAHAGLLAATEARISWYGTHRHPRIGALGEFGINRTCISLRAGGERIYDVAKPNLLEQLDSKLRLQEPRYDGLEALILELMPGINVRNQDQAAIQLIAPLPFDLQYAENGYLVLRTPRAAIDDTLRLVFFFQPTEERPSQSVTLAESTDNAETTVVQWESPIDWPKGAERVKVVLFSREQEIDSIEVSRWPGAGSLRVAVDSYFDPEHEHLQQWVLGRDSKQGQNFEIGVVRLMNLLGVPLVWYGKGATDRRPDVAAILVNVGENRIVVLGKCTREKPGEKFSALRERARELKEFLHGEAEVLPVVFAACEAAQSDFDDAAEHGVSLVGRSELESLLELLKTHSKVEDVIGLLDRLRSSSVFRSPRFQRSFRGRF